MQSLPHLGVLHLTGADARAFLQGQLSQDLTRLEPQQMLLASCNSAQGRVQAILRLVERDEGIWLILPAGLCAPTLTRLRKYVLRAKVGIDDLSASWTLSAASAADLAAQALPQPERPNQHVVQSSISLIRWPDPLTPRFLVLKPRANDNASSAIGDQAWLLAEIRAGQPQVFAATTESFVAQMLNLDLLDGISFTKGCYTGQEIIARTHYRGAIKRRMFRLTAACPAPLPGTRVLSGTEHAGEVVSAVNTDKGCELLAVLNLSQRQNELSLDGSSAALTLLTLPYAIDEG